MFVRQTMKRWIRISKNNKIFFFEKHEIICMPEAIFKKFHESYSTFRKRLNRNVLSVLILHVIHTVQSKNSDSDLVSESTP